ncbi:GNAT family N-acetyltransferase [Halobacteriales archaeon QH_8_64_26]|nr:MAG: GNAT family N-acetyltransferase [Halobacteriales archaeon QH_8_64_26]
MELREATDDDTERISELAHSTMTAAYALSPQQLDAIAEERFEEEPLTDAIESEERVVLVAENGESEADDEPVIVGFVLGEHREEAGELRWLFVDPEHRGKGVGTELYEAGSEALGGDGTGHVTASVLEANTQGGTFFERVGLEEADERQVEIGEQSFIEYVYAEPSAIEGSDGEVSEEYDRPDSDATDVTDADLPGTETRGNSTVARTDDGTDTHLDRKETESGTEAPFVVAYTDAEFTDRYGYYCGNCGSLDTVLDESERIECTDCGNSHAPRSEEAYDGSYL